MKNLLMALCALAGACQDQASQGTDGGGGGDAATIDAGLADASMPDADLADADVADADVLPEDAGSTPDAHVYQDPPIVGGSASGSFFETHLDRARQQVFLSYPGAGNVEVVDLNAGTQTVVTPGFRPEHFAQVGYGGDVYVTLPLAPHEPTPLTEGYIAKIDPSTLVPDAPLMVAGDPWALLASDTSLYASLYGGSSLVVSLLTFVSTIGADFRAQANLYMHPSGNRIYGATPLRDRIVRSDLNGQELSFAVDPCGDVRMHPDGSKLWTRCGHVRALNSDPALDLRLLVDLSQTWVDLVFDPTSEVAYMLPSEGAASLQAFDMVSLAPLGAVPIPSGTRRLLVGDDYVLLVREVTGATGPETVIERLAFNALRVEASTGCFSTVTAAPTGTVCDASCASIEAVGDVLSFTPQGNATETFAGWSGACTGTGICQLTMDRSHDLQASFTGPTESLGVDFVGTGAGTVDFSPSASPCTEDCTREFVRECSLALTATDTSDSEFLGWGGDCTGLGLCSIASAQGANVEANFRAMGASNLLLQLTGDDPITPNTVASDAAGGFVVAGSFGKDLTVGADTYTTIDQQDAFVARFDNTGALVWSSAFGGLVHDIVHDAAIDPAGDVAIAGTIGTSVTFAGSTHTTAGFGDYFVAKYAADGSELWMQTIGGLDSEERPVNVGTNAVGDVFISGFFDEIVDFGAGDVPPVNDGRTRFIAKYTGNDGTLVWLRLIGDGLNRDIVMSMDANGDVIVAGNFRGSMDIGAAAALTASNNDDAFIIKYAGDTGAHLWSHHLSFVSLRTVSAISTSPSGDVYVAGSFDGQADMGSGTVTAPEIMTFLVALTGAGLHDWDRVLSMVAPRAMAVNASEEIAMVGGFHPNNVAFDLGEGPLTSLAEVDMYAAVVTQTGHLWYRGFHSVFSFDVAFDCAFVASGDLLVVGTFGETMEVDGTTLNAAAGADGILMRLAP